MNSNHWANINSGKLIRLELSWPNIEQDSPAFELQFDQRLGQFVHQFEHCQWLSSCFPHFKNQQQTRDIIAGGIENWLVTKNEQCQLLSTDQATKTRNDGLPVSWMLDQLQSIDPRQETQKENHQAQPGWYGGLSYPFHPQAVGIQHAIKNNADWPDALFGFARWVITLDHDTQTATLLTTLDHQASELQKVLDAWQHCSKKKPVLEARSLEIKQWQSKTSQQAYCAAFDRIKSAIDAGDTYQVNFTQCFETEFKGEPLTGFLHLKRHSPSPYAAYWSTPYGTVSSHSPELFIKTTRPIKTSNNTMNATTKPIKGTCPRGHTPEEDAVLAESLKASEKNRAENTMIVDLLRNDLSKTAVPGSMKVPMLCELESFASIHHLVSEIKCDIQPQFNAMDVITTSFPGGSITGAPKRRAMEIIDELEDMPRDIYCGSIGFWDHPQQALFNIAIRTLLFHPTNGTVKIWAGGGIVKDSEAESEYEECFHKVRNLMDALSNLSHHPAV